MPRQKRWFKPKDQRAAKRAASDRDEQLWKYKQKKKTGETVNGYYVGDNLPIRLRGQSTDAQAVNA